MRKIMILMLAATAFLASACADSGKDRTDINGESQQAAQWRKIRPEDIGNSVSLFNDRWMVLSAGDSARCNGMTISWGALGEIWGKPAVTVYVRPSRYTMEMLSSHRYFTVCAFPEKYRESLRYMGTHSGRDEADKASRAGLSTEFTPLGNPRYKEADLCLECRIVYRGGLAKSAIDADLAKENYQDGENPHVMFIGEIVNSWQR